MMKLSCRIPAICLLVLILSFSSCDNSSKNISSSGRAPATVKTEPKIISEDLLSQLPHDTGLLTIIKDPVDIWEKLNDSPTFHLITGEKSNKQSSRLTRNNLIRVLMTSAGKEVIFAQYGDLERSINSYIQYQREYVRLTVAKNTAVTGAGDYEADLKRTFLHTVELPPTFLAFKNGEDSWKLIKSAFDTYFSSLPEWQTYLTPFEYAADGTTFHGYKINLKNAIDSIKTAGMRENTTPPDKNLFILLARRGNYSLFFIGLDASDIRFAPTSALSLAESPELSFLSNYEKEKNIAIAYISQPTAQAASNGILSGLKDVSMDSSILFKALVNLGFPHEKGDVLLNSFNSILENHNSRMSYLLSAPSACKLIVREDANELCTDIYLSSEFVSRKFNLAKPLEYTSWESRDDTGLFIEINTSEADKKFSAQSAYLTNQFLKTAYNTLSDLEIMQEKDNSLSLVYDKLKSPVFEMLDAISEINPALGANYGLYFNNEPDTPIIIAFTTVGDQKSFQNNWDKGVNAFNSITPKIRFNAIETESKQVIPYTFDFGGQKNYAFSATLTRDPDSLTLSYVDPKFVEAHFPLPSDSISEDKSRGFLLFANIPVILSAMDGLLFHSDNDYLYLFRDMLDIKQPLLEKFSTEIKTIRISIIPQEEEAKINLRLTR